MTPLARLLSRYLPGGALVPALALVYAGVVFALALLSGDPRQDDRNPYLDLRRTEGPGDPGNPTRW
ncbi:MAG TPA: hypothetical protein VJN67_16065 [Stellaceae bacterium]|nr:hypothetical protein [Stellaceae bacterium]